MTRRLSIVIGVVAWLAASVPAWAQPEVDALRLYLGAAGATCTLHTGSGAPASGLGAVCDIYIRTDSPYGIYVKDGASTWREVYRANGTDVAVADGGTGLSSWTTGQLVAASGSTTLTGITAVASNRVLASAGVGTLPVYTADPIVTTLTGQTSVSTPTLTYSGGNLTINPSGDVLFDPTGNDLLPVVGYDLNVGSLSKKWLTLHAAELWVETLVAQETIATIGGRVLVGPTTTLTADLTSGATTIQVKHNQIANGDRLVLQANGLIEWMAVTSAPSGSAGAYTYSVTRNLDGSGANAWTAGDAVFNTGTTGDGFIDLYSIGAVTPSKFQAIFNFNATGSAYSSNYAEALQFEFMGDGAGNETNDAMYWGAPATFLTIVAEAMTSCSAGTSTTVWEYWNGSAWTTFSPSGTTCTAGHNAATWTALSGWATTTVNSVSAYWVRLRLTNTPGTPWTTAVVKNVSREAQQWGPSVVGNIRTGTTYSNVEPRWAIGNLNGLYGYSADTYGVALGSPSAAWVKIDPTNGVRLGHNTTTKIQLDSTGNASFSEGGVIIDEDGIRRDLSIGEAVSGAYAFTVSGGAGQEMGMFGSTNGGDTLRRLSVKAVNAVDTDMFVGVSSGQDATLSLQAVGGGSYTGTVSMVAGPSGTSQTVTFTGATLTVGTNTDVVLPDLNIYGNNGSTTSKPYMRSDGNYLLIESRSSANGGVLYLNNDTNATIDLGGGGGAINIGHGGIVTIATSGSSSAIYNATMHTSLTLNGLASCTLAVNGSGAVGCVSDGDAKTDVRRWRGGLDAIARLKPVSFRWKEGDTDRHIGFIAQDVEAVIPDAVRRQSWGGDLLTLDDRAILAALVNAVQELQRRIR